LYPELYIPDKTRIALIKKTAGGNVKYYNSLTIIEPTSSLHFCSHFFIYLADYNGIWLPSYSVIPRGAQDLLWYTRHGGRRHQISKLLSPNQIITIFPCQDPFSPVSQRWTRRLHVKIAPETSPLTLQLPCAELGWNCLKCLSFGFTYFFTQLCLYILQKIYVELFYFLWVFVLHIYLYLQGNSSWRREERVAF
jgi:hypothetical protein